MAKRVLTEARGALSGPPASPTTLFELARRIARLVHETQRERGETAVLLGSDGQRFAAELAAQRAQTDCWIADLESYATAAGGLPGTVAARMDLLRDLTVAVAVPRAAADGGGASPNAVIEAYNDLNARLLEIVDAIATDAPERLRVLGVAFASLMWAKENTGRERAQLAVAFGRDRFAPGQIFTVGALFGAQESFLRLFSTVAPPDIVNELRERLAEPQLGEVRRLEAIALSGADGGFGVDPTHWFEAITRKVDAIGEVGGELSALIAKRAGEP
jgi:methyl-accepting chemotaxis protein